MKKKETVTHSFYCINCGQKCYDLPRKRSMVKEKHHRKKLYCWHCKQDINMVECRTDTEAYEFKQMFMEGEFLDEAKESLLACGDSRIRQEHMGKE